MLKNMFHKYICIVLYLTPLSYCANILALVAVTSYSHQVAYHPLWRELSLRGHNVTLLTTDPLNDPNLTNLTELDIKWAYEISSTQTDFIEYKISMWNYHEAVYNTMYPICEAILSSKVGQDLLSTETKFDLVLVEYLFPELLAFAEIYDCPKILISSMNLPSTYYNILRELTHPVLYPDFLTPLHGKLSFRERLVSTFIKWYEYYVITYKAFPKRHKLLKRYFNNTSTIPELINDIDMLFLTLNPILHGPMAIGPATITIGGYKKNLSEGLLPLNLKKFLDEAKQGCIYVSLGSNVKSHELSHRLKKSIQDALGEVPYKVLWKFESDGANMPENVRTAKWLPQQKVLDHPNLKLFIFQGGLQSIEESIHGEVPFVVIPFFADQYQNARMLENKGIAIVLDRTTLKKDDLKDAIVKMMNDSSYRVRVRKLKQLILDEPMTGLEKAVWWTEYVIRHKGAKHLRNPAADLPFYQYYMLDAIGFLLGIIVFLTVATILILKRTYKSVICNHKKEKLQ